MKLAHISCMLTVCAGMLLSSCGSSDGGSIDYIAVKTEGSDNWGFVGPDGQMLIDDEFENTPSAVINGYFSVTEGDYVVVYKAGKKPEMVKGLDDLAAAGVMNEGRMPICRKKSRIELVDGSGNTIATLGPVNGKEIRNVSAMFTEGLMTFNTDDDLTGAIDRDGNVVIEPKYYTINTFNDGIALASIKEENDSLSDVSIKYMIIDKKGETIYTLPDNITPANYTIQSGVLAVNKDEKCGFINKKGEFRAMPSKVKQISEIHGSIFTYINSENKYGVMNMDKEDVVRAKYESLYIVDDDLFLAMRDNKWSLINSKDERLHKFEDIKHVFSINTLGQFSSKFQFITCDENDIYTLVDKNGNQIGHEEFSSFAITWNYVTSEYFDMTLAVKSFTDKITDTGFDKISIGEPMSEFISGEPRQYTGTYSAEIYDHSGYRYSYTASAYSSVPISLSEARYRTENYFGYTYKYFDHYEYLFNPEAHVSKITIEFSTEQPDYNDLRAELDNQFADKGFKYIEKTDAYATYTDGKDLRIVVIPRHNLYGASIYILNQAGFSSEKGSLINSAESRYRSSAD